MAIVQRLVLCFLFIRSFPCFAYLNNLRRPLILSYLQLISTQTCGSRPLVINFDPFPTNSQPPMWALTSVCPPDEWCDPRRWPLTSDRPQAGVEFTDNMAVGQRLAHTHCQQQFFWHRWNCPTEEFLKRLVVWGVTAVTLRDSLVETVYSLGKKSVRFGEVVWINVITKVCDGL